MGRVFEDVNYSGGEGTGFEDEIDHGLAQVTVGLYDEQEQFLQSTETDDDGYYAFSKVQPGRSYFVRALSSSINDADTIPANGNSSLKAALPEQTFESDGYIRGNGGVAALGGNDPDISDENLQLEEGIGDTNVFVRVQERSLFGVNFGFSYNLVTNNNNIGQGSLRQFIANANALDGPNEAIFELPPGTTIDLLSDLPVLDSGGIHLKGDNEVNINAAAIPMGSVITITSSGNTISGLNISGDPGDGITITGTDAYLNHIYDNTIGTDATGTSDDGNAAYGIRIEAGAHDNVIGVNGDGTGDDSEGNLISGNDAGGILVTGAGSDRNVIAGNIIGLNVSADATIPNSGHGITIASSASGTLVGSNADGTSDTEEANIISGNDGDGIAISATDYTAIQGNLIGVGLALSSHGNGGNGISIADDAKHSNIGANDGTVAKRNTIAFNSDDGIFISGAGSTDHRIRQNAIYMNGELGIDLDPDGKTANDSLDTDTGANELFNHPVITDISLSGSSAIVTGWTRPGAILDFFADSSDEGKSYLASFTEGSGDDSNGTLGSDTFPETVGDTSAHGFSFVLPGAKTHLDAGKKITATATEVGSNTSEFSSYSFTISGRVFEDTNYTGGDGSAYEDGTDHPLDKVVVELYSGTGSLIAQSSTDSSGLYSFAVDEIKTYTIRVLSASMGDLDTVPHGGRNGSAPAIPEQTFESDGTTSNGGTGAFGGNDKSVSDTTTASGSGVGDTNVAVSVSGKDISGVDFGFSYEVITNTNNEGQGSLRQFIMNANAISGANTSYFEIGGSTISPSSELPHIMDDATIIDGYSEDGSITNTNGTGSGALTGTLSIEIDGSLLSGGTDLLTLKSSSNRIRGLVLRDGPRHGIVVDSGSSANHINGNYIGTDSTGSFDEGNASVGIVINGTGNIIGSNNDSIDDAAEVNLISGNDSVGVLLSGTGADLNVIRGNYIGAKRDGITSLSNSDHGVSIISSSGNQVLSNILAFNGGDGVAITGAGSKENRISLNRMWENTDLSIDLGNDGVTANDSDDSDSGPNKLLNRPVISGALFTDPITTVTGSLVIDTDVTLSTIELYEAVGLLGESGEAKEFIGSVTPDSSGNWSTSISKDLIQGGDYITAIAIDSAGNSSELSENIKVAEETIPIRGMVFEDVNFTAAPGSDYEAGTDHPLEKVKVEVYSSTGSFITDALTDSDGAYSLSVTGIGAYTVRVVSASMDDLDTVPKDGRVASLTALPEQTFESNGVISNSGTGALGGNNMEIADDITPAGAGIGDTNVSVTVTGTGGVVGVNFGFNYELVTNCNDTGQGSLRQFVANANALPGENTTIFELHTSEAKVIELTSDLPVLSTGGTHIKGDRDITLDADAIPSGSVITITSSGNTVSGMNISADPGDGITITGSGAYMNHVYDNTIGTNAAGDTDDGNAGYGVRIDDGAHLNIIGTDGDGMSDSSELNTISGNDTGGIIITGSGTDENVVAGNHIGLNKGGTGAIANSGVGITISVSSSGNTIGTNNDGTSDTLERNVISGNTGAGIRIAGSGTDYNVVAGNYIGTVASGSGALGNLSHGIFITAGASNNRIGSTSEDDDETNIIAHNAGDGVFMRSGEENTIRHNSMFNNTSLGIDFHPDGTTSNDAGDTDTGANTRLNFPVITDIDFQTGTGVVITGTLDIDTAESSATVDVYIVDVGTIGGFGEGKTHVGSSTPNGSGDWELTASGAIAAGQVLTATTTDAAGNTSEFGENETSFNTLTIESGNTQTGAMLETASVPLTVKVTDEFGNVGTGVTVDFTITAEPSGTSSGAVLSDSSVITGSGGLAEVTFTFGDRAGDYTVEADFTGNTSGAKTFTLTEIQQIFFFRENIPASDVFLEFDDTDTTESVILKITSNALGYDIIAKLPEGLPEHSSSSFYVIDNWDGSNGFGWKRSARATYSAFSGGIGDDYETTIRTVSSPTFKEESSGQHSFDFIIDPSTTEAAGIYNKNSIKFEIVPDWE